MVKMIMLIIIIMINSDDDNDDRLQRVGITDHPIDLQIV